MSLTALQRMLGVGTRESAQERQQQEQTHLLARTEKVPRPLHSDVLRRLLAENREFAPVLRGNTICNHYSMGLLAAHGLGATDAELAQLHNFLDGRSRQLYTELPLTSSGQRQEEDWTWGLGDIGSTARIRDFFLEELRTRGLDATLHDYMPRLLLGQHKGLFHPMIRLKFGLQAPHEPLEEVAEALAYSYSRHEPLYRRAPQDFEADLRGEATVTVPLDHIEEAMHTAWAQLREMYRSRGYDGRSHSMQVLAELYQDTNLHRICLAHFPVSAETAEACQLLSAQLAAQLYCYQPGLTTLHAVTGAHAISDILPRLPAAAKAVSAKLYWIWLSTLFVEKGCPRFRIFADGCTPVAANAWQDLRQDALRPIFDSQQGPETHVIKLAFTCDALFQKKMHPIYLDVAKLVVGRGRPY